MNKPKPGDVIENEVMSIVNAGQDQGILKEGEAEMIGNIFSLNDKDCSDIMIPKKKMTALNGALSLSEALPVIAESTFSRFPVYENDIDRVIGILHIRDVLSFLVKGGDTSRKLKDIPELLQKAVFVPESKTVGALFSELKEQKTHMVMVVDEYGQTAGLLAMEDVLEEIVGNILDEHDTEEQGVEMQGSGYGFDGTTSPEEAYKALQIPDPPPDFDTMSGFLISELKRIPEDGERFFVDASGYRFYATEVKDHIVGRIHARKQVATQKKE